VSGGSFACELLLAPVQAYLDFRRFSILPRAGGTFDQPAELMDEIRIVAAIVEEAEAAASSSS
jgi:hypothetical protein